MSIFRPVLVSRVPGFEGLCKPTWLQTNQVVRRVQRGGPTGFFRKVKRVLWILPVYIEVGQEFHGQVLPQSNVVVEAKEPPTFSQLENELYEYPQLLSQTL